MAQRTILNAEALKEMLRQMTQNSGKSVSMLEKDVGDVIVVGVRLCCTEGVTIEIIKHALPKVLKDIAENETYSMKKLRANKNLKEVRRNVKAETEESRFAAALKEEIIPSLEQIIRSLDMPRNKIYHNLPNILIRFASNLSLDSEKDKTTTAHKP